jgi:hypothetical protein
VQSKNVYPITILKHLPKSMRDKLYSLKILVANDLLEKKIDWLMDETGLSEKDVRKVLDEVKTICVGCDKK